MSLNTTDGDPAADSYAQSTDTDAYFTAIGNTTWTGTLTVKENALRLGTRYLENQYRGRWIGIATNQTQALAWPRGDGARELWRTTFLYPLLDINGFPLDPKLVPQQIKTATMEAALLVLTGTNLQPVLIRGNAIKSTSVAVDVIKEETVWQDGAPVIDRYTAIEGILRGLVTSTPGATGGTIQLMRC